MASVRARRPSRLGEFDEETCRFFLQELGESTVPYFPFYYGIEQVYECLLARYGKTHVADAMSVLHELLEDDSVAIGIGDEGDAWRSWRYDWKHRNDDPLSPSTPKVGDYLFPPPTPKRVRLVKSANFLALHSDTSVIHKVGFGRGTSIDDGLPETLQILPLGLTSSQSLSSQAYQLLEEIAKRKEEAKDPRAPAASCKPLNAFASQWWSASSEAQQDAYESGGEQDQQFSEINARQSQVNPDDPLLVTFEMMRPQKTLPSFRSRLRGGQIDVRTFRQIAASSDATPGSNVTDIDCDCDECRVLENTIQAIAENDKLEDSVLERGQILIDNLQSFSRSEINVQTADKSHLSRHGREHIGRSRVEFSNMLIEGLQPGPLGHAIKKRMVEEGIRRPLGSLSSGHDLIYLNGIQRPPQLKQRQKIKSFKVQEVSLNIQQNGKELLTSQRRPPGKPFGRPQQINCKKISSLLERGRTKSTGSQTLLHSSKQPKFTTRGSVAKVYAWICSDSRSTSPSPAMTSRSHPLCTSFDGASDVRDRSPSKPAANVNKALPPSPLELQSKSDTLSRSTTSPYPIDSCGLSSTKSPATSNVSSLSSHSTKAQFRGIARGMMADNPRYRGSLSPVNEPHNDSGSSELDKSGKVVGSRLDHISYSSIMAGNPYKEPVGSGKSKGHVPHALSENNIQFLSSHKQTHPADYYIPAYLREDDPLVVTAGNERSLSPGRGRETARTPSPSKALSDVEEEIDEVLQHPKSSRKRSRSPHKRLFGDNGWLTRSQSAKTLPKEEENEYAKKGGLKQWGDKMKRRFEDLATPAPGRPLVDRSTFAISINPPGQARLYSEMELMLCVSGNKFLMDQYRRGRMSADAVAKINASWRSKNRPQVREFQYDQMTQRDLVMANLKTFEFYGDAARNPIILNGVLHSWKALAKEMSVRTFCTGDAHIKKHLLDARRVLEMLGTPMVTFLAFQELQNATHNGIRKYQVKKKAQTEDGEDSKGASDDQLHLTDECPSRPG